MRDLDEVSVRIVDPGEIPRNDLPVYAPIEVPTAYQTHVLDALSKVERRFEKLLTARQKPVFQRRRARTI